MKSERYPYGAVLKVTREDTLQTIDQCLEQMSLNGLNTVVLWPPCFYWEEMSEEYPFRTGKDILRIAAGYGMKVIIELAGQLSVFEYIPDSEMKEEYYALNESGGREWGQASFGFLNYYHPEVKERILRYLAKAAEAYKNEPALLGYDLFNETMFRSYDSYTISSFQAWLKNKYSTIEHLNDVWDRTYSDFGQIRYEQHKWMSIMPEADFRAFQKESIGIILGEWAECLRSVDPEHLICADNIHSQVSLRGDYSRPQDDYGLKDAVGEIGMSFYPKGVNGVFTPAERHQIFSGYYDASGREGFFLSEMQTHIQAMYNPMTAVRAQELRQWCLEAWSHGAKSLFFWMWRPFTKGLQTLGRGLVDYAGRETPRLAVAREVGSVITKYGKLAPVRGRVGIVYDPLTEDFQYLYTEAYNVDQKIYLKSVFGAFRMMFDLGISCDMIRMEEIHDYDAVIISSKVVLSQKEADLLDSYIKNGGMAFIDGKFGYVNTYAVSYDRLPGGPAHGLTGEDFVDSDYEKLSMEGLENLSGCSMRGFYGREIMNAVSGTVLARFPDEAPAVVRSAKGMGAVFSLNTYCFYGYSEEGGEDRKAFVGRLLHECGIMPSSDNENVKVRISETADGKRLLICFNYTNEYQETSVSDGLKEYHAAVPAGDVVIVDCNPDK